MWPIDSLLFLDFILNEAGTREVDIRVVDGYSIHFIIGPSGNLVQILVVEGESITRRVGRTHMVDLGLTGLMDRLG